MTTERAYKLTNQDLTTYGDFQWPLPESGTWVETDGIGPLCSSGWLHFYTHPLLAALLNNIHAAYRNPRLWEAEVWGVVKEDRGLKRGYTKARLLRELAFPRITVEQHVEFGVRCALQVCQADLYRKFLLWAEGWLAGVDRSYNAAITLKNCLSFYGAATNSAICSATAAAQATASRVAASATYAAMAAEYAAEASSLIYCDNFSLIQIAETSCNMRFSQAAQRSTTKKE